MSQHSTLPHLHSSIPRLGNRFSCWLGRTVLNTLGWQFSGEFPKQGKMVIAVAPHTSNWDFVVGLAVVFALKLRITFFGKHSIFIWPFSLLLKRWGGIPIERSRAHGVVEQIATEMKRAKRMILALAPEGTRSHIAPWKTGFLHIAHKADVPVLLVGLDYDKKRIVFGPLKHISADIDKEMDDVYRFFTSINAKYPHQVGFPTESGN